jgi:hypothetical protein
MSTTMIFEIMFGSTIMGIAALIYMEVRRTRKKQL